MGRKRVVEVVEAAYRWSSNEREWLDGIVDSAKHFDAGAGLVGYTVELEGEPRIGAMTSRGVDVSTETTLTALTKGFGRRVARAMYAPTEFVGNAAWRFERVAAALGTSRDDIEARTDAKLPAMWAVVAGDPRRRSVVLGFPAARAIEHDAPFPRRERAKQLALVGAHIGAALRLRASLVTPPVSNDHENEAILSPRGDVLHATGSAKNNRGSIIDAVKRSERARLQHVPDDEALDLWKGLVAGRWSIIDIEERDGKRLLLARRNDIGASGAIELTDMERDVAWLASMGHSYKFIAYELGLSIPAVVRRLESALEKLGIESRRDLVRIFATKRR